MANLRAFFVLVLALSAGKARGALPDCQGFMLEKFGILHRDGVVSPSDMQAHFGQLEKDTAAETYRWVNKDTYKQLNMVDPSLYSVVSGVTSAIFNENPEPSVVLLNEVEGDDPEYSHRFQILPTDFYVDSAGRVEIQSYINNLHPMKHSDLYSDLASIFQTALPLFEEALATLSEAPVDLKGRTLQVATNIKAVYLNANNGSFPGSQWHTEGLKNEHIIASAVYYFDVAGISRSSLEFKLQLQHNNETVFVQLGGIPSKTGRLVVFPNVYQHRVSPFQLDSQTGHRKALTFFLLDPNRRILSTTDVRPQQRDWYGHGVLKAMSLQQALEYRNGFIQERSEHHISKRGARVT